MVHVRTQSLDGVSNCFAEHSDIDDPDTHARLQQAFASPEEPDEGSPARELLSADDAVTPPGAEPTG